MAFLIFEKSGNSCCHAYQKVFAQLLKYFTFLSGVSTFVLTSRILLQGGQMVLVAKRGIPKGEEVTNNYGVHHNNMTKAKRQSVLKTGYKFDCDCQACQDDYPLLGKVDSKLAKKVNKDLDNLIAHYQRLFSQGCLEEALENCCEYVRKLEQNGVKYPHRNYEIGSIAMNSCWWGIIARQSLVHPSKRPSNEN